MQQNYNEFQEGNWAIYHPDGKYCTIKSLSPNVLLQGALQTFTSRIENLGKIKITEDKLQVCGFHVDYPIFKKISNTGICATLIFSSTEVHKLYKNEDKFYAVQFIHQVQNAYYEITGELLQGNLYGVGER